MTEPLPELNVPTGASRFNTPAGNGFAKWFADIKQGVDVLGVELLNRAKAEAFRVAGQEIKASGALTGASTNAGAVAFSITDEAGRRSWLEIGDNGGPTPHAAASIKAVLPPLPEDMPETTAAFTITDEAGRRSWLEIGNNGGPTPHSLALLLAAGVGIGPGTVTETNLAPALAQRIPPSFALADTMVDETRNLTVRDGVGALRPLAAKSTQISFWGDSLFDGWPMPPFQATQSDSVPGVFASLVPGATVYNGGKSGQSTDEIAIRQGGIVPMLTVTGGTIPASGPVAVTAVGVFGWRLDRGIAGTTGTLNGVPGTLTRSADALTFTRATAGTAVPTPDVVPWESFGRAYAGGVQVILAGRNDIGYTSLAGPVVDRVVTATRAMVESLTPANRRVLLLGTITSTGEGRGSVGHTAVTAINNTLQALYPNYFFDYRAWLVKEAIYELGITPTAGDLAKMAADTVPPSIMTDSVHYSPATAAKAAAKIKAVLISKGWL